MAQSISQEALAATGLPGATAASRYAGATASGAPATGTFAVGDYVVDQTGKVYVCTVAGTPGTWVTGASSFSAGTTGLTPSSATTGAITLAGTLAVANGGTGVTTSTGTGSTALSTNPVLYGPIEAVYLNNSASISGLTSYNINGGQTVGYFQLAAAGNFSFSFSTTTGTVNSFLATGQSITIAILTTQGSTAYYNNATPQIDGTTSGVTIYWQGGTAPTAGNASQIDAYTFTIIKTASATYTVLAAQTKF